MTVCIATICRNLDQIIFVTDHLLSSDVTATEGPAKFNVLNSKAPWVAMYAARDATYVPPLLRRIKKALRDDSLDSLIAACRIAYQEQLRDIHETEVLWPYGMTRNEFYEHGLSRLGETLFARIVDRLEQTDTGVTMLVAGYEPAGGGHILQVNTVGTCVEQQLNFHAVGNGSHAALSMLYPISEFALSENFAEVAYRVLAAKFNAESVPGVGPTTFAFTIAKGGSALGMMPNTAIDNVRALWKTDGQPPIPPTALTLLEERFFIYDLKDDMAATKA